MNGLSSPLEVAPVPRRLRSWRLFIFYSSAFVLTGLVSMLFADLLWRTGWSVAAPNLRLSIIVGFGTAFAISWEETVVTLLISGADIATLPKRVWEGLRFNIDPAIAALSVLMIAFTTVLVLAARLRAPTMRPIPPGDS